MDNAKRNLMKASVAVPMLFTVRAASAQALGSVWVCATRDANRAANASPPVPKLLDQYSTPTADEWLRVKRDVFHLRTGNGSGPYVMGSVDTTKPANFFIPAIDTTHYWEVQISAGGVYTCDPNTCRKLAVGSPYGAVDTRTGYFLAYQSNGTLDPTHFGFNTSSTATPITCSCWTSLPRVV